jgi:nitrite reductase (NADH) small subunit
LGDLGPAPGKAWEDGLEPDNAMRHAVCMLEDLADGRGALFQVAGEAVALYRVGDRVFALANVCPHREGPLAFGDLRGGVVYCPVHAWPFDLASGRCLDHPGAAVRVFPVSVEGGEVQIEL